MNITDIITKSNEHLMDLTIDQVGLLDIVVRANAGLKLQGVTKSLDADETFTVVNRAEDAQILAYLVEDTGNQEIHTLVDEVVLDGVDEGYIFNRGDQYKLWAYLYKIDVPGGTSDITSLTLQRWRIIAPE